MKKINFITVLIATIILTACSSSSGDIEIEDVSGDYFPSTESSFWNYNVSVEDNNESSSTDYLDFLSIESTTGSSFDLEVNNGNSAYGIMSAILANGTLTRTDSQLYTDGAIEVPIDGIDDFNIDLDYVKLYDLNADDNAVFSTITNQFTETIDDIPLTFSYTVVISKLKDQSSLSVDDTSYVNVTSSNISLILSVTSTIEIQGIDTTFDLLNEKEILSIDSYFAEDIGLVKSESYIEYELEESTVLLLETLNIELDFDSSKSETNTQTLSTYVIGD